eukprot:3856862-Pleurochrysis_carterae.AAC.6
MRKSTTYYRVKAIAAGTSIAAEVASVEPQRPRAAPPPLRSKLMGHAYYMLKFYAKGRTSLKQCVRCEGRTVLVYAKEAICTCNS